MSETITIGVDHGYAAMKSTHFSYPTGLVEYEHEPYTQKDVLEYGGRFYVVGSGRQPLQKDKSAAARALCVFQASEGYVCVSSFRAQAEQ